MSEPRDYGDPYRTIRTLGRVIRVDTHLLSKRTAVFTNRFSRHCGADRVTREQRVHLGHNWTGRA
jgi:hypothetical protein